MQQTTHRTFEHRWTHREALERRLGLPRGLLLYGAQHQDSLIARLVASSGLDGAMLERLRRLLAVTVGDWVRK